MPPPVVVQGWIGRRRHACGPRSEWEDPRIPLGSCRTACRSAERPVYHIGAMMCTPPQQSGISRIEQNVFMMLSKQSSPAACINWHQLALHLHFLFFAVTGLKTRAIICSVGTSVKVLDTCRSLPSHAKLTPHSCTDTVSVEFAHLGFTKPAAWISEDNAVNEAAASLSAFDSRLKNLNMARYLRFCSNPQFIWKRNLRDLYEI